MSAHLLLVRAPLHVALGYAALARRLKTLSLRDGRGRKRIKLHQSCNCVAVC